MYSISYFDHVWSIPDPNTWYCTIQDRLISPCRHYRLRRDLWSSYILRHTMMILFSSFSAYLCWFLMTSIDTAGRCSSSLPDSLNRWLGLPGCLCFWLWFASAYTCKICFQCKYCMSVKFKFFMSGHACNVRVCCVSVRSVHVGVVFTQYFVTCQFFSLQNMHECQGCRGCNVECCHGTDKYHFSVETFVCNPPLTEVHVYVVPMSSTVTVSGQDNQQRSKSVKLQRNQSGKVQRVLS